MQFETLWTFNSGDFRVTLECAPEQDPDLSWADEETLQKLESGEWGNFTFKVAVYWRGREVCADYLGNSIYADPRDFRDHRACGRQNREYAAKGISGRCGSYFSDMVHEAIKQTRQFWKETPRLRAA